MPELHLDIHEEILARSQVEDLIRFKHVCKSWKSLISSRRFVKSHLDYNSKKQADTRIDFGSDDLNCYRLVGSSNGLLCIYDRCDDKFFIINPLTCEVNELNPPQDIGFQVWGFGYDSSIDDFKVVGGGFCDHEDNYGFRVLALKSNVWRSVDGVVEGCPLYKNGRTYGTLYNGVIHWLFRGKVIVTFDLSKDVIIEIPLPVPPCDRFHGWRLNNYTYTLGTIKDSVCIKYQGWGVEKTDKPEIWVVKNYNVMKTERIEMERWLPPPGYDEHGAAVLVHNLECRGPRDNIFSHIKLSTMSECNYNFDLPVFVKSLKSPRGMGDDYSGNEGDSKAIGAQQ